MIRMKLHIFIAESGLTQEELSKRTGIRQASISGYVSNTFKHIVREHLDSLCDYFHCSVEELVEHIENSN
jgi:putative transcriptional regulator